MSPAQKKSSTMLTRLDAIDPAARTDEDTDEITAGLRHRDPHVVAKAARLAGDSRATDLVGEIVAAFQRLMAGGPGADKGCRGKTALLKALNLMDYDDTELYLQAIRYTQMEPVFGGQEDTAGDLRSNAALGLARQGYLYVYHELTTLLVDPEVGPRLAAIHLLADMATEPAELLLRLKALTHDADPAVMDACFGALMRMAPVRSLSFVAGFLDADDPTLMQTAALALGESRLADAFTVLKTRFETTVDAERRKLLLLPIAVTRSDESFDYLLRILADAHITEAVAALEAMRFYIDEPHQSRIRAIVAARDEDALTASLARVFGD